MWMLRLNMTDRSSKLEELPEDYAQLAGRGLTSTLIHDEVPPDCHPLGPNNKLVFSPGFVTGTPAPTSARLSVGAKSPLTGTIKESNVGSEWPQAIAVMRIRALVVATTVHPSVLALPAPRIFTFGGVCPDIDRWMYEGLVDLPSLGSGGSVAGTEMSLALRMG